MECPDPECREGLIERINQKEKCLLKQINTKVSKPVLITVASSLIGLMGYFTVYGLSADAKQKKQVNNNTQDIAIVKKDIEHIKDIVKRIEDKQISKRELVETIRDAMGK